MLDNGRFPVEFSWFSEGSNAGFMWPTGGLVERLQEHHGKWAVADPTATPQKLSLQSAEKIQENMNLRDPYLGYKILIFYLWVSEAL